jgi:23S rRNA pseudouridine2605 synthase
MRQGIYIAEGFVKVEGAKVLKARGRATEMEIILREGKNREIRRILARLGHKVQQLRRIAVGPLKLGDVPAGAYRAVSKQEIEKLWAATEMAAAAEETKDARGESRDGKRTGTKKRGTKKKRGGDLLRGGKAARGSKAARGDRDRSEGSRESNGGGRPVKGSRQVKKSRPTRPPAKGEFTFNLGESRSSGAIIGGEPAPAAEEKREKRGGTKKRSTRTSRPKSGTRSEGDRESAYKRGGKGAGKKFPSKGAAGKPRTGVKKKRRKP